MNCIYITLYNMNCIYITLYNMNCIYIILCNINYIHITLFNVNYIYISMVKYKKDVTPLPMHWSYIFFALTHQSTYGDSICLSVTWPCRTWRYKLIHLLVSIYNFQGLCSCYISGGYLNTVHHLPLSNKPEENDISITRSITNAQIDKN